MGHRGYAISSLLLGSLLCASAARAGPVEQLVQVVTQPTDPNTIAVRYTNGGDGILYTHDGGQSWQLLCDSMLFDVSQTHGASIRIALAADGTSLMGTFSGLWHDDAHACNWVSESRYDSNWIADFALDPLDPSIVYAITSTASRPNGLIRRDASGSWSDLGAKEERLLTALFAVRRGDGRRFYLSGVNGIVKADDAGPVLSNYVTRFSDDDGASWTEYVYGTVPLGEFRLQAVDPSNPDRIVASISVAEDLQMSRDEMDDRVLVSSDRGKTWKTYLTITEIGGVAFAPDGRIFIGDLGSNFDPTLPRGVWAAAGLDTSAKKLAHADYPVQCLLYQAATDTLRACQHFWFGTVDTKDGTFTQQMSLTEVPSMVACDGVDSAAVCMTQLCLAYCGAGHYAQAPVCEAYDTPSCGPCVAESKPVSGCGTPAPIRDAGAVVSSPKLSKRSSGGCCAIAPGSQVRSGGSLPLVTLLTLALALRRTRRARVR